MLKPNTLVITRAIAQKFFGGEDPSGKVLHFPSWNTDFTVAGVIEKVPVHFHFDFFVSMAGMQEAGSDSWLTSGFNTYLLLKPGYDYRKPDAGIYLLPSIRI